MFISLHSWYDLPLYNKAQFSLAVVGTHLSCIVQPTDLIITIMFIYNTEMFSDSCTSKTEVGFPKTVIICFTLYSADNSLQI